MLMPCNVLWCLAMFLCFYPNLSNRTSNIIYQLWISYAGLAFVALATPDLSDLVVWGEVTFFFASHFFLLFFPVYFIAINPKISLLPDKNSGETLMASMFKWFLLSCSCFALLYFAIVAPVGIASGFNLNYMLHPPPNPGDVVSGPNFRVLSIGCCAFLFFIMRLLALVMEVSIRAMGQGKTKVT